MVVRALIVGLLLLLSCAPFRIVYNPANLPLRLEWPTFVTPEFGIEVYVLSRKPLPNPEVIAAYLDASERALRDEGYSVQLSRVYLHGREELTTWLWGRGLIPISGLAYLGKPEWGMEIVWWNGEGASSYVHERMHQIGYAHDINGVWDFPEIEEVIDRCKARVWKETSTGEPTAPPPPPAPPARKTTPSGS